jgi:hypothetical protein
MNDVTIQGECAARFRRVREVFAEGFRSRNEVGAAVAVMHVDAQ